MHAALLFSAKQDKCQKLVWSLDFQRKMTQLEKIFSISTWLEEMMSQKWLKLEPMPAEPTVLKYSPVLALQGPNTGIFKRDSGTQSCMEIQALLLAN